MSDILKVKVGEEWITLPSIKGEKGDKGDQGIQGETGPQGIQGIQGIQGEKGDTGNQGPQGIQGETGAQGPKGDDGLSAGFGTPTASITSEGDEPSVVVTASGPDTAKIFDFAFSGIGKKASGNVKTKYIQISKDYSGRYVVLDDMEIGDLLVLFIYHSSGVTLSSDCNIVAPGNGNYKRFQIYKNSSSSNLYTKTNLLFTTNGNAGYTSSERNILTLNSASQGDSTVVFVFRVE